MRRFIIGIVTHGAVLGIGFALGIYMLPILTAPPSPDQATLEARGQGALFSAEFAEDLRGQDFLHWGRGTVRITPTQIVHMGELAPGPDYMVYLVLEFVEHEEDFLPLKDQSRLIGPVKTFGGFALEIPADVDPAAYTTVLVWC